MPDNRWNSLADLIEYRYGLPTDVGKDAPAEGMLARVLDRRSHRRWTEDPVPEDLLQLDVPALIIPGQYASHATSAARYSPWRRSPALPPPAISSFTKSPRRC